MSLSFLYPLMWFGAVSVAVPIWLHLRRRSESEVFPFSALQFLEDQPLARARPLWPRHWPLLVLRILGLLLLVAAFAWPYLQNDSPSVIRESRVYVLDNTLSHQVADGFQKSRDTAIAALDDAGADTQNAVVELTDLARVVAGFSDARAEAANRVQQLEPSHRRGSYLAAFRLAADLLNQSLGERKRIVFLGDSQRNQWSEGENIAPFLEDIRVDLPQVAEAARANVALRRPSLRRLFLSDRVEAQCAVTLDHWGDSASATLVVRDGDAEVLRREVPLAGAPPSLILTGAWDVDPRQWLRCQFQVQGEPDALAADNYVYASLPPVREGRVLLLARSTYLQTALSPGVAQGRWTTTIIAAPDETDPNVIEPDVDVICMESEFLASRTARDLMADALDRGTGVVLLLDHISPLISGFLRELGIESRTPPHLSGTATSFRYVFLEHPIFHPFRSTDFGNLLEVKVHRYLRLAFPAATPLVFSQEGDPLMFEATGTKGRLLVLAFPLDRNHTNWPLHPTFIPFLDRCLSYARGPLDIPPSYQPGQMCVWNVGAGRTAAQVVVSHRGRQILRAAVRDRQAQVRIPDEPGQYELRYDDQNVLEGLLDVNPPPDESELVYETEPKIVQSWQGTGTRRVADAPTSSDLELTEQQAWRQRIWWWLLLGGLTAMAIETSWVSVRKHRF